MPSAYVRRSCLCIWSRLPSHKIMYKAVRSAEACLPFVHQTKSAGTRDRSHFPDPPTVLSSNESDCNGRHDQTVVTSLLRLVCTFFACKLRTAVTTSWSFLLRIHFQPQEGTIDALHLPFAHFRTFHRIEWSRKQARSGQSCLPRVIQITLAGTIGRSLLPSIWVVPAVCPDWPCLPGFVSIMAVSTTDEWCLPFARTARRAGTTHQTHLPSARRTESSWSQLLCFRFVPSLYLWIQ